MESVSTEQVQKVSKLDESIQAMTLAFKANGASFSTLFNLTHEEHHITRQYLDQHVLEQERTQLEDTFINGLLFSDILRREEQIKDAYKGTFQNIIDQSNENIRPWSNFMEWL